MHNFLGGLAMPIPALVVTLAGLAAWGIAESVWVASMATVFEIAGLVLVVVVSAGSLATLPARAPELIPPLDATSCGAVLHGAFLLVFASVHASLLNLKRRRVEPPAGAPRWPRWVPAAGLLVSLALLATQVVPWLR